VARRTLLLIASILLAALGTALIWLYVQGAENRAQRDADLVPAVFLTRTVQAGSSPVGAVTVMQVPTSVAANAVTNPGELGTLKLRVEGVTGQILLRGMLSSSAVDTGRFPAGGAVSLTVNDPNRVPADLRVGDTVDVVALTKDGKATVVLTNITVRTIGPAGQAGTAGTGAVGAPGANGTAQNGVIPATIIDLNATQDQALTVYGGVARGDQFALYLHK
jgi:pilus assembly protein CpaB